MGQRILSTDEFKDLFDNRYLTKVNASSLTMVQAFNGQAPTIGETKRRLGSDVAVEIISRWIIALSDYYGKGSMTDNQISELSSLIISGYHHMKLPEFALFLKFFKLGRYNKFFGSPDPQAITTSINSYLNERKAELDKYDRLNQSNELQSKTDPDAISINQYCKIIGVETPQQLKLLFAMEYQMYNQTEEIKSQIEKARALLAQCQDRNQAEGRVSVRLSSTVVVLAKAELVATEELKRIYIEQARRKLNINAQN